MPTPGFKRRQRRKSAVAAALRPDRYKYVLKTTRAVSVASIDTARYGHFLTVDLGASARLWGFETEDARAMFAKDHFNHVLLGKEYAQ